MPRNYSPYTPSGDPSNPLSLLSQSINVPQVNFTAQTQVAEPENQFAVLQRIIGEASGAATMAMRYEENKIKNQIAVDAAIERANKQAEMDAKERQRDYDASVRENQETILNTYDAKITAAMLKGTEEGWAEADKLSNDFAGMYPVEQNPFMANKAQDYRARVIIGKKSWDADNEREAARLSVASRGSATSDVLTAIENVNSAFDNVDTRGQITDMWVWQSSSKADGTPVYSNVQVPDDQLHIAMNEYFMNKIDRAKLQHLNEEDRVALSDTILRQTNALRANVIKERNRRRTYDRIEMRNQAAITTAVEMRSGDNMEPLFSEFDNIANDRESGLITDVQQRRLESNLAIGIGENAGKENPVVGAISYSNAIANGIAEGKIPMTSGQKVIEVLRRRAAKELDGVISGLKTTALSAPNSNEETALYEATIGENPAITIGNRFGIYTMNEDGTTSIVPGMEPLAKKLDTLSNEWIRQEALYKRTGGVFTNVEVIDSVFAVDSTIDDINTQAQTPLDRSLAMEGLITENFAGVVSFSNDPEAVVKYLIPLKRMIDGELTANREVKEEVQVDAADGTKVSGWAYASKAGETEEIDVGAGRKAAVSAGVAADPAIIRFAQLAKEGNIPELIQSLSAYHTKELAASRQTAGEKPTPEERMKAQRANDIYASGINILLERTMTDSQKRMAKNPINENEFSRQDMAEVLNSSAKNFRKNSGKMTTFQRNLEEERIARLATASDSVSEDWIKYIDETYFKGSPSVEQLKRGYDLIRRSQAIVVDGNGRPMNYASQGTVAFELVLRDVSPVMFDTMVLAEAMSQDVRTKDLKTVPVEDMLTTAHGMAVRINQQFEGTRGRAKELGQLFPSQAVDPRTGLPVRDVGTLFGSRAEALRKTFNKVYNNNPDVDIIPTVQGSFANDPYFSMPLEDQNRLNTLFQGYLDKGYPEDAAMKSAVQSMKRSGYKLTVAEGARVGLTFDPFNKIPPEQAKLDTQFREWIDEKVSAATGISPNMNVKDGEKPVISWILNEDLGRIDSKLPFIVIMPNGERFELAGNDGIDMKEFEAWKKEDDKKKAQEKAKANVWSTGFTTTR